jgi:hypothetical protein
MLDRLGYGVLDVQTDSGVGFEDVRRYSYVVDPELSPRATAIRLQKLLGRPFTEREARAAWDEILEFKLRRVRETGEDLSIEQAAREWDERYGLAFRRRWYLTQPEPGQRKYLPGGRERRPGPVGKVAGAVMPELAPLLESGFSVADVLGAAKAKPRDAVRLVLRRVPKSERARHYVRLIAKLTGWQLSNEEAERVWVEVLKHKVRLSRRYGQDVPVERALVDYFKRMRLSGLDRTALWETGQLLNPERAEVVDNPDTPSTKARALFPA